MAKRPDCSKVIKSARQLEINDKFTRAVKYGQYVKDNQELCKYYRKKREDLSAYNSAISDFMSNPVVECVDVGDYHGLPGNVVLVSSWDKWNVEGVSVVSFNARGEVIECGAAVPREFSGNREWEYKATVENSAYKGGRVEVHVTDRPGNVVQSSTVFNGSS